VSDIDEGGSWQSNLETQADTMSRELGAAHPETLRVKRLLATKYLDADDTWRAVDILQDLRALQNGVQSAEAQEASFRLGVILSSHGEFEQAESILVPLLADVIDFRGTGSTEALQTLEALCTVLFVQGKRPEVLASGSDVIAARLAMPPESTGFSLKAIQAVAQLRLACGDRTTAAKLYRRVVRGCLKSRSHPDLLRSAVSGLHPLVPKSSLVRRIEESAEAFRIEALTKRR